MESTTALGSCKRRRPFTASGVGNSGDKRNETQGKATGRQSLRTIMSSSDEDDEFFDLVAPRTPFRKLPRVSIGSDRKAKKDTSPSLSETPSSAASTKKSVRKSEGSLRRYSHTTDSDSDLESNDDCNDTLDGSCETTPQTYERRQHELNDHSNDLTDTSEERSATRKAITFKRVTSKSVQPRSTTVLPTTGTLTTGNAGCFASRKFSEVESQRHVITTTGSNAKFTDSPSKTSEMHSDGNQSVDSVQLTHRLRASLGAKHGKLPTIHSQAILRESPGDDYSSSDDPSIDNVPKKSKELLTPCQPDDEDSVGEQSVDTVQLTCRLRANLGLKLLESPSRQIAGKDSTCGARILRSDDATTTDKPTVTLPTTFKERLSNPDNEGSIGGESVDTTQLTRRLRGNFGMKQIDPPAILTPPYASIKRRMHSSTPIDAPLVILPAKSEEVSSQSIEEHSTDEQSVDTAQLTRRLRANLGMQTGNSPPIQVVVRESLGDSHIPREIVANGTEAPTLDNLLTETKVMLTRPPDDEHVGAEQSLAGGETTHLRKTKFHTKQGSLTNLDSTTGTSLMDHPKMKASPKVNTSTCKARTSMYERFGEGAHQNYGLLPERQDVPRFHSAAVGASSHKNNVCPLKDTTSNGEAQADVHEPVSAILEFRLPSQSESSADEDSVTDEDDEKEQDTNRSKFLVGQYQDARRLPSLKNQDDVARKTGKTTSSFAASHDLYKAAFGDYGSQSHAPPASCIDVSPTYGPNFRCGKDAHMIETKESQISSVQRSDEKGDEELFHEAFVANNGHANSSKAMNRCIVLLDSDSDDCESRQSHELCPFKEPPIVHTGLRTTRHSPRFNIASRVFPKCQGASTTVLQDIPTHDDSVNESDDSGNEDNQQMRPIRARRVTQDHAITIRRSGPRSFPREGNVAMVDTIPAPLTVDVAGGHSVGVSGLTRPWRQSSRPRIRDAAASNPLNAASAASARSLRQGQAPVLGRPERFGTLASAQQRQSLQQHRNDIHGGSGAGIAGFTFSTNRTPLQKGSKDDEEDDSNVASGSDEAPTSRPKKRKKAGSRRKTTRTLRGRKTAKSSTKRSGWSARRRGRGSGKRGVQGTVWGDDTGDTCNRSEAFNKENLAMRHVGGAEITF